VGVNVAKNRVHATYNVSRSEILDFFKDLPLSERPAMLLRFSTISILLLAFALTAVCASGATTVLDTYQKQATDVSGKRVKPRMWSNDRRPNLMQKRFPFKKWDSHFSSLGSKRAPIALTEKREKKRFKTKTIEFPNKAIEMSEWDGRLATLQRQAQISTDDSARKIADKQLYNMALQDIRQYQELGVKLSLRDINRYQFRHNRSNTAVPVRKAGAGR
jgi:hypothetical protein